jgi:hypothetical protein
LDIPHLSFTISSFFFLLLQPSHCFSFSPFFHAPSISSTPSFSLTSSFSSYLTSTLILTFPPPSFFSSFHFRSFFFSRISHYLSPLFPLSLTHSSLTFLSWSLRRSTSFIPTFPLPNSSFLIQLFLLFSYLLLLLLFSLLSLTFYSIHS